MKDDPEERMAQLLASIKTMPAEIQAKYRKQAGENLGRIRDRYFPNKLSAMTAKLQEGNFRKNLNPKDLERQLRRWISDGLPLGNIKPLSRALEVSAAEFIDLNTPIVENPDNDLDFSDRALSLADSTDHLPEKRNGVLYSYDLVKKRVQQRSAGSYLLIGGLTAVILLAVITFVFIFVIMRVESIDISWPRIVDSNSEYVSGQISHLSEEELGKIEVKLFVKPLDGDNRYWLDCPPYPGVVTSKGTWYQKCRFGDEDIRTMKQVPPLRFDLYAVLINKGDKLPIKDKQNFIDAENEALFIKTLKPRVRSISKPFTITRVKPPQSEIPIVIGVKPPVRITWAEDVPMYLEIFHRGQIVKDGFFRSGQRHDLLPSPILYEIKMSRKKGYHQSHTWMLVEEGNN